MNSRFDSHVAVVSGAASGIGAATARQLCAEGAAVALVDIDEEAVTQTAAAIGSAAWPVVADLSDELATGRAVDEIIERFGSIKYLVNSAGIQTYGTVIDTDIETWQRTIDVNLKSAFLLSRAVVPHIGGRGGGAVVNVASVQAIASQKSVVAYAASKGGLLSMTRTMALDHAADNIRVNAVLPGAIDTPMLRWAAREYEPDNPEAALAEWGARHPLGRVGRAEEVAETIAFLCGEGAGFITGTQIVVDGGLLAGVL